MPFLFALGGCSKTSSQGSEPSSDTDAGTALVTTDGGLQAESAEPPRPSPAALLEKLNPTKLPVYDGPTAILEGHVYVKGPAAPELDEPARSNCKRPSDYRLFREGEADEFGRRPLADAIVGVTGYRAFVPAKSDSVEISVKKCEFDRRTVVLTLGQRLHVKSNEALGSGLFYMPKLTKTRSPADQVVAPGQIVKLTMDEPGRSLLIDGMANKHLYADVFVSLSSLHVVTDKNGHFLLPGVPVGELDVNVLHPSIDAGAHKKLVFKAGQTTRVDFELDFVPKGAPPDAGGADASAP